MSELFKLKNGSVLISTEAPGGIYNSAQLKKIAELCSKELAIVKATEDQRLALFVKESEIDRISSELKATGLGFRNYQSGLHQPVSCLGELCETHEQAALASALDLTKLIADLKLQSSVKIGINGCARCCTPCHTLDISVIGEASGYRISMGGKTSQFPELASFFAESVPPEKLPRLLTQVIEIFQAKAEDGETFNEVLDRCGVEDFVAALAPYSQDAAHRDDPFAVTDDASAGDSAMAVDSDLDASEDPSLDTIELEMEESPPAESSAAEEDDTIELEMEEIGAEAGSDDAMNFDLRRDADGDNQLGEIPIAAMNDLALSDEIKVSDDDPLAVEETNFDTEAELITEALDEPEASVEPAAELAGDADGELDLEAEAALVTAALASESETERAEGSEADQEEAIELEFEDSVMSSEELMIHEPELLDAEDDLEADVPQLATEAADIPELDEDLLQSNAIDPSSLLLDEGDEGDEGAMMSIEDEQRFEQKIQDSIEEEKKMRDGIEDDINQTARADALLLLQTVAEEDGELKADDRVTDSRSAAKDTEAASGSKSFDFDGFDVTESTMRVHFSSGAYLDVQLDSLDMSRSRVFRMGHQTVTVTHEADGYSLEVDGMRMFYPHQTIRAAS